MTQAATVHVAGSVSDLTKTTLTVNGTTLVVAADGGFAGDVAITEGANTLAFVAGFECRPIEHNLRQRWRELVRQPGMRGTKGLPMSILTEGGRWRECDTQTPITVTETWRLSTGCEAGMSEGHTYRCSWALTTTGYRLWLVADPELVREDAVFADPAEELGYAILNKTGDREAKLEFEPPPPGTALRAAGVASAVAARSPRHRAVRGLCDNCLMPLAPGLACRWISSRRCRKVT